MDINKNNLLVIKCCSNDKEAKIIHHGIHFTKGYTEATNGYSLVRITYPIQTSDNTLIKNEFTLYKEGLKEINKSNDDIFFIEENEYTVNIKSYNKTTILEKMADKWPNTDEVFPQDLPVLEIAFNPSYLKNLCDIAEKLYKSEKDDNPTIFLSFYGKDKMMRIKTRKLRNGQQMDALLMPKVF